MSDILPTDRRNFLSQVAGVAVAVVATTVNAEPLAAATFGSPLTEVTDAYAAPFDDSWTLRVLAAKHKAVFDAPEVADGIALEHAVIYMNGFRDMFDVRGADIVPVVVLRHTATVVAMNNALWERFELGELVKLKDPLTDQFARRNPFIKIAAGEKALVDPGSSLEALQARGVVLLTCNRAVMGLAGRLAKKLGRDVAEVRAEMVSGIVPGVLLQPSGIYATTRAQEVGCSFMRS